MPPTRSRKTDNEGVIYEFAAEPDGDNWTVYRWILGQPQHKLALISYTTQADATHIVQSLQLVEVRHRLRIRNKLAAGMTLITRRG